MKNLLVGLLALGSVSAFAGEMNFKIEFESQGSKPQYIRIGSTLAEGDQIKCDGLGNSDYKCSADLGVVMILETATLSVISDTLPIKMVISSVEASYQNTKCEMLTDPISGIKNRLGARQIINTTLDLSVCH